MSWMTVWSEGFGSTTSRSCFFRSSMSGPGPGDADCADRADRREDPGPEWPIPEPLDHQVAHAVPVFVAHPDVNALVPDHGELPVLDGEIDEHAVALARPMHVELREDFLRALERVAPPA